MRRERSIFNGSQSGCQVSEELVEGLWSPLFLSHEQNAGGTQSLLSIRFSHLSTRLIWSAPDAPFVSGLLDVRVRLGEGNEHVHPRASCARSPFFTCSRNRQGTVPFELGFAVTHARGKREESSRKVSRPRDSSVVSHRGRNTLLFGGPIFRCSRI